MKITFDQCKKEVAEIVGANSSLDAAMIRRRFFTMKYRSIKTRNLEARLHAEEMILRSERMLGKFLANTGRNP